MLAGVVGVVCSLAPADAGAPTVTYARGPGTHGRPRALAVDARGDVLYVALSTQDRLAVVQIGADAGGAAPAPAPKVIAELRICAFPAALAPLPDAGVVVACRFDPVLRVVTRDGARFRVRAVDAGPEHGHRGLAVDRRGDYAYVASPPVGGVKIVSLRRPTDTVRVLRTGTMPETVRLVPADPSEGRPRPLLLVANFVGHTVTVHDVADDGSLSASRQTIATEAPVRDMAVVPGAPSTSGGAGEEDADDLRGALLLLTHEDRPLTRRNLAVEGLDSVVLVLPPAAPAAPTARAARTAAAAPAPFIDPGPGRRRALNLGERDGDPVIELQAIAAEASGDARLAIAGAGTDNLLVAPARARSLLADRAPAVGANPSAVVFLPDGRVATADRLSDTVSFVEPAAGAGGGGANTPAVVTLPVGSGARHSPAERGELLFQSRALVPNNVAAGPLSLYTCAACHADGHLDGRRHPSKRDRFFSMTKSCRGLAGTEPFLNLGFPETFHAFADNIVGTHAQGALESPDSYDRYPVELRLRSGSGWTRSTLSPADVRTALAAYMAAIPHEPSPFVSPGRVTLTPTERRGLGVFREGCSGCHLLVPSTTAPRQIPPAALEGRLLGGQVALTSARRYDVGTPVLGEGGNNPPSLKGVWSAAPYFSDGSAASLEALLARTNPDVTKVHAPENAGNVTSGLTPEARADLLAFLRSL
jgi:hypothetical protein